MGRAIEVACLRHSQGYDFVTSLLSCRIHESTLLMIHQGILACALSVTVDERGAWGRRR